MNNTYCLVHCISSDFALGKGIAKQFANKGVKTELLLNYKPNHWHSHGYALYTDLEGYKGVFNLVTKQHYYDKPTYNTIEQALHSMKFNLHKIKLNTNLFDNNIKLAMPLIGCGLDQLEWDKVKSIIEKVFTSDDIEILICRI